MTAKSSLGSKIYVLNKFFGTYDGKNVLQVFEDKYLIVSGCYKTTSLKDWIAKAREQVLTQEVIDKEVDKIRFI